MRVPLPSAVTSLGAGCKPIYNNKCLYRLALRGFSCRQDDLKLPS